MKSLIVYYSHSGNTGRVAKIIQRKVGGDFFRIELAVPYPQKYREVLDQARKELASGHVPELKSIIENMDAYDVIFVGSPNWLNTMAPPVKAFLMQYDFSDKIMIPFCTHGGGGNGHIFADIAKACKGATVKKGFETYGNGGSKVENEILDWLKKIEMS